MEFLRWWWRDKWELKLCFGTLVVTALLVLVKVKVPTPEFMQTDWPLWTAFFQSKTFEDIVSSVLASVVAAYFFYIFIELFPRFHREKSALQTLNYILASIVDAYMHKRGYEDLISLNDTALLGADSTTRIIKHLAKIRDKRTFANDEYIKLRMMLFCVHSRMNDFRSALPLATTLSPLHALHWLQLADRAQLIYDEYDRQPVGLDGCFEPIHVFGSPAYGMNDENEPYKIYKQSMIFYADAMAQRLTQFLLEVQAWMALPGKPEPTTEPETSLGG